ncbi:sigma factor-like helix-turn-helix DNA-binding protein [Micromonospora aurantiaca]|uniref:sigma factor-like helix-turn-helix DNA-binding protein n=1 Tax=Micromonospora aurantiaca (nom. illeg.) TaxID=47850 RepID=UPI003430625B
MRTGLDLGSRLEAAIAVLDDVRQQLAEVLPAMRLTNDPLLNRYLGMAHRAGFTLEELGRMIGCTRERVRQRIAAGDPDPPRFTLNAEGQARLRDLHARADGRASKRQKETLAYREELARLREAGATVTHLAQVLGVTHAAVRQQIRLHERQRVSLT